MDHQSIVFASIFPVPSLSHTTPTPVATPDLGSTAPVQSFGSPFLSNANGGHRAVRRYLAWSTATRFLSLPKQIIGTNASFDALRLPRNAEIEEALHYLLVGEGKSDLRADKHEESLVNWYTSEARLHFANLVRPTLKELWNKVICTPRYGGWVMADRRCRSWSCNTLGTSSTRLNECYNRSRTSISSPLTTTYSLFCPKTIAPLPQSSRADLHHKSMRMEQMLLTGTFAEISTPSLLIAFPCNASRRH